jgi:hypothetical protein
LINIIRYLLFLKGSTLEASSVFAGYCVLIAEAFILVLFFSLEPTDPRLMAIRMDRAMVGILPYLLTFYGGALIFWLISIGSFIINSIKTRKVKGVSILFVLYPVACFVIMRYVYDYFSRGNGAAIHEYLYKSLS